MVRTVRVNWRALEDHLLEMAVDAGVDDLPRALDDVSKTRYLAETPELWSDERTWEYLDSIEKRYDFRFITKARVRQ